MTAISITTALPRSITPGRTGCSSRAGCPIRICYGYPFSSTGSATAVDPVCFSPARRAAARCGKHGLCAVVIAGGLVYVFVGQRYFRPTRCHRLRRCLHDRTYLLIDTLIRGNSPEALALLLLPLILWSSRRYLITDKSQFSLHRPSFIPYFLVSVFSLAPPLTQPQHFHLHLRANVCLFYLSAIALIHKLRLRSTGARIGLLFLLGLGMTIFTPAALCWNSARLHWSNRPTVATTISTTTLLLWAKLRR